MGFPLLGAGLVLTGLLETPLLVLPGVRDWGALAVWLAGAAGTSCSASASDSAGSRWGSRARMPT